MMMPAFGAYAGGLDIREDAITRLFQQSYLAYALGSERVYAVAGDPRVSKRITTNDEDGTLSPSRLFIPHHRLCKGGRR